MTLLELRNYFAAVAAHCGATFVYGNSQRILNRQTESLTYPAFWLEAPSVEYFREGGLKKRYAGAFLLLDQPSTEIWEDEDGTQDATLSLTQKALRKLQADADASNGAWEFDYGRVRLDRKEKWSADDDWGWRTEFVITAGEDEFEACFN